MHLYRITRTPGDPEPYFESTRENAHQMLQDQYKGGEDARVELINVKTDKESLVEALNCLVSRFEGKTWFEGPLRTWKLTPRGGLREVPNGE